MLNYHIGRFILVWVCVGDLVRLGLSSTTQNGLQKEIFEFKREEITGGSRKLYKEKLPNLFCPPNTY